jgi:uncharacterized protein YjiS (DUF1127 family)
MNMLRRLANLVVDVFTWPVRVVENRRVLAALCELDDRGLADIGLTRQDLRDATALPVGVDASVALAERARERENNALRARRAVNVRLPIAAE